MKDQTSLIVIIVSLVAMIATLVVFYFQRTQVTAPANPAPIVTTTVEAPAGAVAYTNALPGGGAAAGGGAPVGGPPAGGFGGPSAAPAAGGGGFGAGGGTAKQPGQLLGPSAANEK
jgi:hypothetical protein